MPHSIGVAHVAQKQGRSQKPTSSLDAHATGSPINAPRGGGPAGRPGGVAGHQPLVRCWNSQDVVATAMARMAMQHVIAIQAS